MSHFLLVCERDAAAEPLGPGALETIAARLAPRGLPPRAPHVVTSRGLVSAIFEPVAMVERHEHAACLGAMFPATPGWWVPGRPAPDGSYALFRADGRTVELISDVVASRTIWVHLDDRRMVASTSQRAMAMVLGDVAFDARTLPWMLSVGVIGPGLAWDRRVRPLGPDTRLRLDRATWRWRETCAAPVFRARLRGAATGEARLREAIDRTLAALPIDDRMPLLLSGGCDSRALLFGLARRGTLSTVTFGLPGADTRPESEAGVAARLARGVGARHRYLPITRAPLDEVFDDYVAHSEARTDRFAAYIDGMRLWRELVESGVQGVVRGDEGFGWTRVLRSRSLDACVGLLSARPIDFGLRDHPPHHRPPFLARRFGETLATQRDRLFQTCCIPTLHAGLNQAKAGHVEIASPFLARPVLDVVRAMPDRHRTDKAVFRRLVAGPVPFRRGPRELETDALAADPAVRAHVAGALDGLTARGIGARYFGPEWGSRTGAARPRLALRAMLLLAAIELLERDAAAPWNGGRLVR